MYRFGIYITDTLVKYSCQWSLFSFHCILQAKKRCKNFNERITQTLCILNFPIWERHEMELNIQRKRVIPRELHFPFPKKWKSVCKVAMAGDD